MTGLSFDYAALLATGYERASDGQIGDRYESELDNKRVVVGVA